jgi:hypothetical protein
MEKKAILPQYSYTSFCMVFAVRIPLLWHWFAQNSGREILEVSKSKQLSKIKLLEQELDTSDYKPLS